MSRAPDHDDPDLAAPVTIWHRLNRALTVLIVLGVVALMVGKFLPELRKQQQARREKERLELLVKQREQVVTRKQRQVSWLRSDPSYVEIIARDRLDLMKEGETIYRLELPKTPAGPVAGPPATPAPSVPPAAKHRLN